MLERLVQLLFVVFAMVATPALAAGSATPKPPDPPPADFSVLPQESVHRGINGDGEPHQVEIRLITDKAWVRPGDTVRVGLWLEQDEHWHTYWKVNGEVGQPTDITWGVPSGWTSAPYLYPVPQRFDLQGIVSYGYDDQVMFFTEVTVPDSAAPGPVELSASASWLTCEVQCIPGEGSVKGSIEVRGGDAPELTEFAPIFDHFAAQHPASEVTGVTVTGTLEPETGVKPDEPWKATFKITPANGVELGEHQPLGPDPWPTMVPIFDTDTNFLEGSEVKRTDDGGLEIVLTGTAFEVENPQPMEIGGLFQVQTGDTWTRSEVTIPMEWDASVTAATAVAPDTLADADELTGDPMVDEATCAAMKAGVGNVPTDTGEAGGLGTVLLMLGAAFLGGLILNVMPCVLPVLTLKVYGLIEQKTDSTKDRITEGLAYTAGIVFSFLALAGVLIALQVIWGQRGGWGFMFQYPVYTGVLATLVFGFGLSLMGVFEIPAIGGNAAGQASYKEGVVGYFMTGVFATLLATPCTAPFLGTAMGFAFSQPPLVIALFFAVAGLGLASPFLLVAFIPALYKILPQPGAWMDTFKQLMGFTLILTTAWLVGVLASQVSQDALINFLWFLAVAAIGFWVYGHFGGLAASMARQLGSLAAAVAIIVLGGYLYIDAPMFLGWVEAQGQNADVADDGHGIPWRAFNDKRMASVLARYREGQADEEFAGKPLFIDFTAEWCLTCKANEKTFIDVQSVEDAIRDNGAIALKGDWTKRDENIGSWLSCYQTAGVPYYLVLPADPSQPAIPLGETLTGSAEIIDAIVAAKSPGT